MIGDKKQCEGLPSTTFTNVKGGTGFTLVEILVAIAIFSFMVSVASGLLVFGFRNQKINLATQELLDQTSYLSEYMSRAIRMAKKDMTGACTGIMKANYAFSDDCLKFINYEDDCQRFCLEGTSIKDEEGNDLTSEALQVTNFNVNLAGQAQYDDHQPRVTFFLEVSGREGASLNIQTTISQRNLDIQK